MWPELQNLRAVLLVMMSYLLLAGVYSFINPPRQRSCVQITVSDHCLLNSESNALEVLYHFILQTTLLLSQFYG